MSRWVLPVLLGVMLVACQREDSNSTVVFPTSDTVPPSSSTPAAPAATVATAATVEPELDHPTEDVPPATAPVPGTFEGYASLRFGMSAAQVKQGWGGELAGAPVAGSNCYQLRPTWAEGPGEPALMIENDKFVRYDVGSSMDVAPGGGQVGMSTEQIRTAYAGRVEEQPHKYDPAGKVLRIKAASGGVVVFEVDGDDRVSRWRVGVPPQVDYVEGCS